MRVLRGLGTALAAAAALCGPALAAGAERPRICIAGVRADAGGTVAAGLAGALCTENACVPAGRVRRGGKLDFAAVKDERVAAVLFGTVASARGGRRLELALLTSSLRPERTWVLPIGAGGRLAPKVLDALADDVRAAVRGAPATSRAPSGARPTPAAPRRAEAAQGAERGPGPEGTAPQASRSKAVASLERSGSEPAPARRTAAAPAPDDTLRSRGAPSPRAAGGLGAFDLGVQVVKRDLAFQGVGSGGGTLQRYQASAVPAPSARLEVYPFAPSSDGWAAGLALLGAYARSFGFESKQAQTPGVTYPTTLQEIALGVGWRFRPVESSRATLRPRVGWRWESFVLKASGGGVIAGLPDAHLSGPSLGIDAEVPLAGPVGLIASAAYTRWTTATDLVGGSPAFFSSGSAWAAGAEAGLSVALRGPVSLRLTMAYERTAYTLSGSSTYSATGATDSHLSGQGAIRIGF